ncbi:MAG: putative 2-5 ligase [Pseudobdellovibrio sp.]|nr:putative 2-5 ligase [Pseudobdellovibrio sp.]
MRLFYALKIDLEDVPEIKNSLRKLKKDAVAKEWEFKFTPPENLHITLNFLGDVNDSDVKKLCEVGQTVAALHPSFSLKISGFDAFPELQHARVIWAGVQNKKNLQALYEDFEKELSFLNRAPENAYVPHLTLARLRNPHSVKNFLSPFLRKSFGSIECKEIGLYKSELRGLYPHYELIQSFNLKPAEEKPVSDQVF